MIPAWFDVGVLTVVTALLGVWVVRRAVRLRRPRGSVRSAMVLLAIATVLFGWALAHEVRHQWTQARATALIRELTGYPDAHASCQRFTPDLLDLSQYAGHVSFEQPHAAHLRRGTCNTLASWLVSDKTDPTLEQVNALHVLVHEAIHVTGEFNEGTTECIAMQRDAEAAELLGAAPSDARALADAYYQQTFPRMSSEYRSPACVPDGALDLSPGDGRFP